MIEFESIDQIWSPCVVLHVAPIYPKQTLTSWHVLTHAAQKVWGCEGDEGEGLEQAPIHAMCRDASGQWEEGKAVHHQDQDMEAYHCLTGGTRSLTVVREM